MRAAVNVNGRITAEADATVSVFDHGFLFGEGVYETIRTYNGRPFLLDRHLRRLRASADRLHLPVDSDRALGARVMETLEAVDGDGERYVRMLLTRGVGDLSYDPAACPSPTLVVIARPLEEVPDTVVEQGARISLVPVVRNHPDSVNPLIKSNNLLNNALAMQHALRHGGVEGLMCNYRGELAECAQANFFLVTNGEARTPPLSAGLLGGITRELLLEIGPPGGVPVCEAVLTRDDLVAADEAFFTSTTKELVPVVQVDDRVIGAGRPGPVTRGLLDLFRRTAAEMTRRQVS